MKIKTAQIGYKPEPEETVIDITVKNNPNHVLSPTWDMVIDFKKGRISWDEYKEKYVDLLRKRWKARKKEFMSIIEEGRFKTVVLLCFCSDESRCHRTIAKEVIEKIYKSLYEPFESVFATLYRIKNGEARLEDYPGEAREVLRKLLVI